MEGKLKVKSKTLKVLTPRLQLPGRQTYLAIPLERFRKYKSNIL